MPDTPASLELLPCPQCIGRTVPQITRGGRSQKYFLTSIEGCHHVWSVINYQNAPTTETEARERWNAWVAANPRTQPTT